MTYIIANIFGSKLWEYTEDSLRKNGSFYFETAYFPTKYAALWGIHRSTGREKHSSLAIYYSQPNLLINQERGPHQITWKSNDLIVCIPNWHDLNVTSRCQLWHCSSTCLIPIIPTWAAFIILWSFKIKFIGEILVNKIIQVLCVQLNDILSVYRIVCPPLKSNFLPSPYIWPLLTFNPNPIPSGNHQTIVYVHEFLFVCGLHFYISYMNEIMWFLTFSVWFISYYLVIRKDKILPFAIIWIENIILREILWAIHLDFSFSFPFKNT